MPGMYVGAIHRHIALCTGSIQVGAGNTNTDAASCITNMTTHAITPSPPPPTQVSFIKLYISFNVDSLGTVYTVT